jgi:hypothetical protein
LGFSDFYREGVDPNIKEGIKLIKRKVDSYWVQRISFFKGKSCLLE